MEAQSERLFNSPRVTQLATGRGEFPTQVLWLQSLGSEPLTLTIGWECISSLWR